MKVLEEKIDGGESRREVIQTGKKKYTRTASVKGIDWRRYKTNHQVKEVEFDALEKEYGKRFPLHFVPSAFTKEPETKVWPRGITPFIENDKKRRFIERQVISMTGGGNKLAAVKYVKDKTGWLLRDSKLFVDALLESMRALRNN